MNSKELEKFVIDSGLAVSDPNHPGRLLLNVTKPSNTETMGDLTPVLVQHETEGQATLSGLYSAFEAWKASNLNKIPIHFIQVMGGDGKPGIIILYK